MADWIRYANSGAIRNLPLSPKMVSALEFLPELGVTMEVFSGGQPAKGHPFLGKRVGSTRHDNGNAADVFFSKGGRRLDWNNSADIPIYQEIVRRAKAAGLTGFGAGPGYMRPGSMHIGYGTPTVWGDGGSSANAPAWLRDAYYGAGPTKAKAAFAVAQDPKASDEAKAQNMMALAGMKKPEPQYTPMGQYSPEASFMPTQTTPSNIMRLLGELGAPQRREEDFFPMPTVTAFQASRRTI